MNPSRSSLGLLVLLLASLFLASCSQTTTPANQPTHNQPMATDPKGLSAEYFSSNDLSGVRVNQVDRYIFFDWDKATPARGIVPGDFSAQWQGYLKPLSSGSYQFQLSSEGKAQLFIDGKAVSNGSSLDLEAGKAYSIRLSFQKTTDSASLKLEWSLDGAKAEIIPQNVLYPLANLDTQAVITGINLLLNSDFEAGTGNWVQYGGGTLATVSPGRDGTGQALSTSAWAWIQQNLPASDVEIGQNYTLLGYGKALNGASCTLGFAGGGASGETFNQKLVFRAATFEQQGLSVALPANTSWMAVYLSPTDQACQFDDLSLIAGDTTPPPPPPSTTEAILNGGFEQDLTSWQVFGGTTSISTSAQAGSKALNASNFSWIQQNIPAALLEVGKSYTFSAYGNSASSCTVGLAAFDSTNQVINETLAFSSASWQQASKAVTIPAGLTWAAVYISSPAGICALDSISFASAAPVQAPASPTNFGATATSSSQINLSWTASSGASSYVLERKTGTGSFSQIATPTASPYSDTNLASNTTYTYQLTAVNSAGSSAPVSASATTQIALGTGTGLLGEYYDNMDFTGTRILRTDASLNFDWATGSPISGMGADTFSIRWTGQIQPLYSNTYTFYTTSDDGVRLWINNQLIINSWIDQAPTVNQGTIALSANQKYDIRLEYYENGGGAAIKLEWSSASQSRQVLPATQLYPAAAPLAVEATQGQWGAVQNWPLIATHMANLTDGRVLAWASYDVNGFGGQPNANYTQGVIYNPSNGTFTEADNPTHDMFCAGLVTLADGRIMANGGGDGVSSRRKVSIFNGSSWSRLADMINPHWYGTAVAMPNGEVMVSMGADSGGKSEIYRNNAWQNLPGVNLSSVLSQTSTLETPDWFPYMHVAPNGKIFHSGATTQMDEIDPSGVGSILNKGSRGTTETYRQWGSAIMMDEGKILMTGGTPKERTPGSLSSGVIIDINGANPVVTRIPDMAYTRTYHTTVLLPTGEALVIGGNGTGVEFNDELSRLVPEIYNPASNSWTSVAAMSVPRNYHSTGTLLQDGRVLIAGGGLCRCAADHQDGQIYTPAYLFNSDGSLAARPTIAGAPNNLGYNQTFTVTLSGTDANNISNFSLIKLSANTHAMNTDLRRINVQVTGQTGPSYTLKTHSNNNVLTPGYYYLFAVSNRGVPSVAKILQVK